MRLSWIVIALAALVAASGPALARGKARHPARCAGGYVEFSWLEFFLGGGPDARPNGCAPPVFSRGRYVGQDPDPSVRLDLRRDPDTGYENIDKR